MSAGQAVPRILLGGLYNIAYEVREVEILDTYRVRIILIHLILFLQVVLIQMVLACIRQFLLVENTFLEEVIESLATFG